ncbi:MAG: hypothetical protein R3B72_47970 [Polyangiaceae bacterium]
MTPSRWGPVRRLGERFFAVYLGVHLVALVLPAIPVLADLQGSLVLVVSRVLFGPGVPDGSQPSGSGDRAVDWAAFVLALGVAALLTAAWLVLRPRRGRFDERFVDLVRLFTRLYLALALFGYGAVKVLKSQFPAPSPAWLDQALGDSSPMRLLWAFMGASTSYTVFTGLVECLAGALLLARPTRLLGALLTVAVMTNVLLLNLSYDVGVKLGSSHYLLAAAFVAWPDRARLTALLVPPASDPWPTGLGRRVGQGLLGLVVVGWLGLTASTAWTNYHRWGDGKPHHPLEGRYDVERFVRDREEIPSGGSPTRWQRVIVLNGFVLLKSADARVAVRSLSFDDDQLQIGALAEGVAIDAEPQARHRFDLERAPDGKLTLRGNWAGHMLVVTLAPHPSRLEARGFHWVTEQPYNR